MQEDAPYTIPDFESSRDDPLVYLSFGSLGAGDTALLKRMFIALGRLTYRVLANVGDYEAEYADFDLPGNVKMASWYPQPSVIPQVDAVIHHGGNNRFTECLYFGRPALIMPYVWDGHDNAIRVQETNHGLRMHRADWKDEDLASALATLLSDRSMHEKLAATSAHMRSQDGTLKAVRLLDGLLK